MTELHCCTKFLKHVLRSTASKNDLCRLEAGLGQCLNPDVTIEDAYKLDGEIRLLTREEYTREIAQLPKRAGWILQRMQQGLQTVMPLILIACILMFL